MQKGASKYNGKEFKETRLKKRRGIHSDTGRHAERRTQNNGKGLREMWVKNIIAIYSDRMIRVNKQARIMGKCLVNRRLRTED
jgi:hypothetical protein